MVGILFRTLTFFILTTLLLVLGCRSVPVDGPTRGADLQREMQWHKIYSAAQASVGIDLNHACKMFRELAADKEFPLYELAQLRTFSTCTDAKLEELRTIKLPQWLDDLKLDISIELAKKSENKADLLPFAIVKSKKVLPQSEKVQWIQTAIEISKSTNQESELPALYRRMYMVAPRLNPSPKTNQYLAVAGDYRRAREFKSANRFYEIVLSAKSSSLHTKVSALKGLRLSYKNSRQIDKHLQACQRLVLFLRTELKTQSKSKKIRSWLYDAEIYRGRALWTQGDASAALKIFKRMEKQMKGWQSRAELYWLLARMAEERRELDTVSSYLNRALGEQIRDAELREKILWYLAWNERSRKGLEQANLLFADLAERTESEFVRARARFWQGRTLMDGDRKEEARAIWEKLRTEDPIGYYGLLAHRELGVEIKLAQADPEDNATNVILPFDERIADWLALTNERDVLNRFMILGSDSYKNSRQSTQAGWFKIFRHFARGGLYQNLFHVLYELPAQEREQILGKHPDLLFPQPWRNIVSQAALTHGVQEELVYSIMRQESAFEPRARSTADAFGLMQVLPEVATVMKDRYAIPYSTIDDLYDPSVNIPAGAAHIKELLDRHKGQFILAVAAYNASERAIKSWMSARFRGDPLEFIEEIPYEETRTYIRLVMRNLIFYNLLQSKSASIDFPNWVLKLDRG